MSNRSPRECRICAREVKEQRKPRRRDLMGRGQGIVLRDIERMKRNCMVRDRDETGDALQEREEEETKSFEWRTRRASRDESGRN